MDRYGHQKMYSSVCSSLKSYRIRGEEEEDEEVDEEEEEGGVSGN